MVVHAEGSARIPQRNSQANYIAILFRENPLPDYEGHDGDVGQSSGSTLLRDGIGQAIRQCAGGSSAGSGPVAECAVGHRTEISSPGRTRASRSSSCNELTVDGASRIDAGGKELITTVSGAHRNGVGKAVVEQASMRRCRGAGRRAPEILDLSRVPDGWKRGGVCRFSSGNASN